MRTLRVITISLSLLSCYIMSAQDMNLLEKGKALAASQQGSPVVLSGDTLFRVYSSYGSFSAEERARAISTRLQQIIREPQFFPDSIEAIPVDKDYYIMYRDQILLVISKKDTIGPGVSQEDLSLFVISTLKENLAKNSKSFNFWFMVTNIGYTLLVLLILITIIKLLNWLFRKIVRYSEKNKDRLFRSIKINEYEFLTAEKENEIALSFLKIVKIGLIIVLFLIALPVIFSIFPATEGITRNIIGMVWNPVRGILSAIVNYMPKLITIIVIYFIFKYLIRFIRFLSVEVEKNVLVLPGFHSDWAKPTYNIIRVLLYAFMFIVIFPYLPGSDSPIFKGVSVFLGVLLSLGSSSLISNAMAGMVITYMRPYKIGDRIKIDDIVGDVVEKSLMITRIKTIKNEDVTIPNAKILTGNTVNYSTPTDREGLIIHTTVTIGYDAPWRTVHQLLINAAQKTDGVIKKPAPFVLQTSLDDFFVSYQINAYIKTANTILKIKSDLHMKIQDEFNNAGVEIMSPHYRSERDGNAVTIPEVWDIEIPPMKESPSKGTKSSPKHEGKAKPAE